MNNKKRIHKEIPAPASEMRLFWIVLCILGIACIFYLFTKNSASAGAFRGDNVLLITIDTLRADHLPAYGYKRIKTPNLDGLAAESLLFEDAVSHAPMTLPAHTAILTGLLPTATGIHDNAGYFLSPQVNTLAKIFQSHGYATAAFVSSFVLDSTWRLNQGFDVYFDHFTSLSEQERKAEDTEREAAQWLSDHRKERFFCWVHFYDPHDPYDPPVPYKTEYASHLYDGEIAYTDEIVGRLMERLKNYDVENKTIIVVTGDHGEGLGEHGEPGHSLFLYNTTQHVPLLIRLPNGSSKKIAGLVRHIDIAPSLLDWTALPIPKEMQGMSLVRLIENSEHTQRKAFSESLYAQIHYGWSPLRSLTTDEYRYIDAPKAELYDRHNDPNEIHNLIAEKPSIAQAMKHDLSALIPLNASQSQGPQPIDPEAEEKLRSLGYLSSVAKATTESQQIDPKDEVAIHRMYQEALSALEAKNYDFALQRLNMILEEFPQMTDAHFSAGVALAGIGDYDHAIQQYEISLKLRPDHTMAAFNLANAFELKGDLTSAELWYRKVLAESPNHRFAILRLAELYRRLNEFDKAQPYFAKAIQWHENALKNTYAEKERSLLYSILGELYYENGEPELAEQNLKSAVLLTPERPTLHYNLGLVYEALQDFDRAINEYKAELQLPYPYSEAYLNLGILYQKANRVTDARWCYERLLQIHPDDKRPALLLTQMR